MPFRSLSQKHLFEAAKHDSAFAKKVGISQETATNFVRDSAGQDTSELPEHVPHKAEGGLMTAPKSFRW